MEQKVSNLIEVFSKRADNTGARSLIEPYQFDPDTMVRTLEELEPKKKGKNVSNA